MDNASIEKKLEELNQKMNFLIGGVLNTKYKNPFDMAIDEIQKETEKLNDETDQIFKETEDGYEEHVSRTDKMLAMNEEYFGEDNND